MERRQRVQVLLEESLPTDSVVFGDNQHLLYRDLQALGDDGELREMHLFLDPFSKFIQIL